MCTQKQQFLHIIKEIPFNNWQKKLVLKVLKQNKKGKFFINKKQILSHWCKISPATRPLHNVNHKQEKKDAFIPAAWFSTIMSSSAIKSFITAQFFLPGS